jgi:hypothetical protein
VKRSIVLRFLLLLKYSLFLWVFAFHAESATQTDFQTWLNVTAIGNFYKKNKAPTRFNYWLEGQERVGNNSRHFTQTLLRPGLGYTITSNLSLWIGYGWVYTGYPLTPNPFEENRIWEQLLWVKTIRAITITSRTRMGQRFLENNSKTALRARQLLKISVPLRAYKNFSFVSSDELFWHKNNFIGRNSTGFDQNRFFIGLGYRINPKITTEFGYMNQYIRRFGVPNFLANIASVNFFLSL